MPNNCETSLTVTGAGGFGKTCVVTALCHHPVIKEQFKDGVVFIVLGPQATDPSMKLSQVHHLLTGQYLRQNDINHAEQEINQLISIYYHNLLVIIDDVWHVEDAEPIVKAFSNCKIVLTTRMNDIEQYIPTKQVVSVGPMEQSEAINLLTYGVIDISQLSQEDVSLLDELIQDVHLWPLLLSLVRGQLFHNVKRHGLTSHEAIQKVQATLNCNGLTAFDKNKVEKSRKYAIKVCINVTLELLAKTVSDKMKSLIFWNGIGTSLQTGVLHVLWNTTEQEASNSVDTLWNYGLVSFTDITIPPYNNRQRCIEVHAVISRYIIENIESREAQDITPLRRGKLINRAIGELFTQTSGVHQPSLSVVEYLNFVQSCIENYGIPIQIRFINTMMFTFAHGLILGMQQIQIGLNASPNITIHFPTLHLQLDSLISDCQRALKLYYNLSRKLNQNIEQCLAEKNYRNVIQILEQFLSNLPTEIVAKQAITLLQKTIPFCQPRQITAMTEKLEAFKLMTYKFFICHPAIMGIKVLIKKLQDINRSIEAGSPEITYMQYTVGNMFEEDFADKHWLRVKEIAPTIYNKKFKMS